MSSPAERLSRWQRARTPRRFARWLVERVKAATNSPRVAVLWCAARSTYRTMPDDVECYGPDRDAWTYQGPWPIIAHPTCGPWGKLRWRSRQCWTDGVLAMSLVHSFGGIIEQPEGSQLFRLWGQDGRIEKCRQGDYGLAAPKPTMLYVVLTEQPAKEQPG